MPTFVILLLAILALTLPARAQDGEDFSGNRPERPNAPVRAALPKRGSGEVTIAVQSFGVGNITRPGEAAGVWLAITDSADKARNVIVRLKCEDIDGDSALMQRIIITNPGQTQLVWMYLHVPFANQDTFEITAFEAEAGAMAPEGEGGDQQQYLPGRMLGNYRYAVNQRQTAPIGIGLIGLIGGKTAGLEQYRWSADPCDRVAGSVAQADVTLITARRGRGGAILALSSCHRWSFHVALARAVPRVRPDHQHHPSGPCTGGHSPRTRRRYLAAPA